MRYNESVVLATCPSIRLLENLSETKGLEGAIRKHHLAWGDQLQVQTRNSTYLLSPVEDGYYLVSGGWFDQQKLSPFRTRISGCTWGGSAIATDVVAAPGLFLEFTNPRVMTSRIERIRLVRGRSH